MTATEQVDLPHLCLRQCLVEDLAQMRWRLMGFAGREDCWLPFGLSSFVELEFAEFDSRALCAFGDFHSHMARECLDVDSLCACEERPLIVKRDCRQYKRT